MDPLSNRILVVGGGLVSAFVVVAKVSKTVGKHVIKKHEAKKEAKAKIKEANTPKA